MDKYLIGDYLILDYCPFCGSTDLEVKVVQFNFASICCNHCGARGPIVELESVKEKAARLKAGREWNTRYQEQEKVNKIFAIFKED